MTLIEFDDPDPILDEYRGCPVFESHGDCACSTGIGVGCARPKRQRSEEEA